MKVACYISFFDESPSWLSTVVAGFGRFCDLVIAHDGAYRLFPGGRPRSHPEQAEAVIRTAEAMEIGCFVYRPSDVYYGNEVEKRNEGLRIAGTLLEPGVDWLLIADADYHLLKCDPEMIRTKLAETERDVGTYVILDGMDFMQTPALEEHAQKLYLDTEWTVRTRDIYRWNPTLEVGPAHWCYSAEIEGERRWLRGPYEELAPCVDLEANLVVYHRRLDRPKIRRLQAEKYYQLREQMRTEFIPEQGDPNAIRIQVEQQFSGVRR